MKIDTSDWRLQGQEKYLKDKTLHFKKYSARTTKTDHDHCEFCSAKFSDNITDDLKQGFSTLDDYRWICENCFNDFKERFNLKLSDNNTF
jgi:hypothetical protein